MKSIYAITLSLVLLIPACSDSNNSQSQSKPNNQSTVVAVNSDQPAPVEEKSTALPASEQPQSNTGSETWEKTKEIAADAADKSKEYGEVAVDKTKEVYGDVKEKGAEAWDKTKEVTGEVVDTAKEYGGKAVDKSKDIYEKATK